LTKSQKIITGSDLASLLSQIAYAKTVGVTPYDGRTIHKLQTIFTDDLAENDQFKVTDLLKIFNSLIEIDDYQDK
jgi:hypothetical protein